jgi:hypothetical protein
MNLTVSDGDCVTSGEVDVTCTAACPEDDGAPCRVDICQSDGTTTHQETEWAGCEAALSAVDPSCPGSVTVDQRSLLEQCAAQLGDAVAAAGQSTDVDAAWQQYESCAEAAAGCGNTPGTAHRPLAVFNSDICDQTDFLACRQKARDQFVRIDAPTCLATGLSVGATAGPAAGWVLFQRCLAGAVAKELFTVARCASDNSCSASQDCVAEKCVDRTITVLSASYGTGSCGTPAGNVTGDVAGECNGKVECDVFVDNSVFGDPSYGCAKDFAASWQCGADPSVRTADHDAVVDEGYTVTLSCK